MRTDPWLGKRDARSLPVAPGPEIGVFPMIRFDDWARDAHLERTDVVKMDIEGSQLAALRGMRETLERLRPRLMAVEVDAERMRRAGVTKSSSMKSWSRPAACHPRASSTAVADVTFVAARRQGGNRRTCGESRAMSNAGGRAPRVRCVDGSSACAGLLRQFETGCPRLPAREFRDRAVPETFNA